MTSVRIKKIVHKNIPKKENAVGLAYNDVKDGKKFGTIVIEKDQTPLQILDTEIHEAIHMRYPEIPEQAVTKMGTYLAKFLWKLKYRKQ
jgi:Mg2+/Co2+ transporter CorC